MKSLATLITVLLLPAVSAIAQEYSPVTDARLASPEPENWLMYRRGLAVSVDNSAWSPPGMYAATVRMADGRRDPDTGRCTAISSALKIEAVRTFIVHPPADFDAAQFDLRGY